MQIGDDQQLFVRPVQRAGRIGEQRRAGEGNAGFLPWIPVRAGTNGRSAPTSLHRLLHQFVRRLGEERIGASP
jgi:hypothetical protein